MSHYILQAAQRLASRKYSVIPIPRGEKKPNLKDWPNQRLSVDNLAEHFNGTPQNIGLLCGEPSMGLVDVDIDKPEARLAAQVYLPTTSMRHGRASNPSSHWWYRATTNLPTKTERFKDVDGKSIIELRSTGGQTLVPPSTHPSGEALQWEAAGEPAAVDGIELLRRVQLVAAVTLIGLHWPERGSRHDCVLALAGVLLRSGFSIEDAQIFIETAARIAGDEEATARRRDVASTADRLDSGGQATGRPTLEQILGDKVVSRLNEWLNLTGIELEIPASNQTQFGEKASISRAQWPAPPHPDAYYGLVGNIVEVFEPHTEADPVAILSQTLTAFGNAIGRSAHLNIDGTKHYTNLFMVLVGRTSRARKGTALRRVQEVLHPTAPDWAESCIQANIPTGESLVYWLRDPVREDRIIKDKHGEIEGLETVTLDPGVEDKRLLLVQSEFALILKFMIREGNTLSGHLREAWDCVDQLRSMAKTSHAIATGPFISLVGHITDQELKKYLTDTEITNGFANRILWFCARRSKLLPLGGRPTVADVNGLVQRMGAAMKFARDVDEVTLSDKAKERYCSLYPDLTADVPGMLGAVTARGEVHVLRLALIYALLNHSSIIEEKHLTAGLAVWDYSVRSAAYIFGDATGDAVADTILIALREAAPQGLTQSEISRSLLQRNCKAAQVRAALLLLEEARLIRSQKGERTDSGRPAISWFACGGNSHDSDSTESTVLPTGRIDDINDKINSDGSPDANQATFVVNDVYVVDHDDTPCSQVDCKSGSDSRPSDPHPDNSHSDHRSSDDRGTDHDEPFVDMEIA